MSRLIVVSNRVAPIQEGRPAAGGLAIGVLDALKETGGVWFGWSGETVSEPSAPVIEKQGNVTYATVGLTKRDYDQYYRGFSNATLWPTFHYRNDLSRYDRQEYAGYQRVNATLAKQLKELLKPDDIIWVHDYHLLPFARCLREIGVKNPIGFFLHIPFPVPEVLARFRRTRNWSKRCAATTWSVSRPKRTGSRSSTISSAASTAPRAKTAWCTPTTAS
jgi:trehalose 6-phosphate synthase